VRSTYNCCLRNVNGNNTALNKNNDNARCTFNYGGLLRNLQSYRIRCLYGSTSSHALRIQWLVFIAVKMRVLTHFTSTCLHHVDINARCCHAQAACWRASAPCIHGSATPRISTNSFAPVQIIHWRPVWFYSYSQKRLANRVNRRQITGEKLARFSTEFLCSRTKKFQRMR
jgi:hypothetical protein